MYGRIALKKLEELSVDLLPQVGRPCMDNQSCSEEDDLVEDLYMYVTDMR